MSPEVKILAVNGEIDRNNEIDRHPFFFSFFFFLFIYYFYTKCLKRNIDFYYAEKVFDLVKTFIEIFDENIVLMSINMFENIVKTKNLSKYLN